MIHANAAVTVITIKIGLKSMCGRWIEVRCYHQALNSISRAGTPPFNDVTENLFSRLPLSDALDQHEMANDLHKDVHVGHVIGSLHFLLQLSAAIQAKICIYVNKRIEQPLALLYMPNMFPRR